MLLCRFGDPAYMIVLQLSTLYNTRIKNAGVYNYFCGVLTGILTEAPGKRTSLEMIKSGNLRGMFVIDDAMSICYSENKLGCMTT